MNGIITPQLRSLIKMALVEDMPYGDITSDNLDLGSEEGIGVINANQELVVAGIPVAMIVFESVDDSLKVITIMKDGDKVETGEKILEIHGNIVSIMKAERTALNFLQRLSGIASLTSQIVDKLDKNTKVKITDTRKTTPLWRHLEKYAVRMGGGYNHRFSLSDTVMIKDNHITAVGGITESIKRIRAKVPHTVKVEIEVSNLEQVNEAVAAGADIIMLDNMEIDLIEKAVNLIAGKAMVEVSGGMTPSSAEKIAKSGVDIISMGILTHSAPAVDISLKISC